MLNKKNLDAFMTRYATALALDITENPDSYTWGTGDRVALFDGVVAKMRAAYVDGATGGVWPNKSRNADKACRSLGIRPTFKALGAFLTAEVIS